MLGIPLLSFLTEYFAIVIIWERIDVKLRERKFFHKFCFTKASNLTCINTFVWEQSVSEENILLKFRLHK